MTPLKCKACRIGWERKGEDPPCSTCIPPVLPGNKAAVFVYMLIRDQINAVGSLDVNAIWRIIDEYKIPNRTDCFERVLFLGNEFRPKSE
jgi:hypothetical protein